MEFTEETQQTIIDLQNQINELRALTYKNDFSNTYLQNKTVIQHTGAYQSPNFVTGSTGWQFDSDGNLEANSGTFRGALVANSLDIPDTTTANSFHVDTDGNAWWGAAAIGSAVAKVLKTGVATFTNVTISGGSNVTFISDTLNTSAKKILKDFTFEDSDFTGNLKTGDITWNTSGEVTGGSGILINAAGLVGATAGVKTFSIDAITGDAVFSGTLAATGGNFGTITAGNISLDTSGYIRSSTIGYDSGTGFWLGYSSGYKFFIGNSAGNKLTWDGSTLLVKGQVQHSAGDILLISADAQQTHGGDVYTKKKEIYLSRPGTYRIKFTLGTQTSSQTAYGRIYKNGAAVGTERTESAGTPTEFSEDISGWAAGDLCQLYIKIQSGGDNAVCKNFRIYVLDCDNPIVNTN